MWQLQEAEDLGRKPKEGERRRTRNHVFFFFHVASTSQAVELFFLFTKNLASQQVPHMSVALAGPSLANLRLWGELSGWPLVWE